MESQELVPFFLERTYDKEGKRHSFENFEVFYIF